jgi:hypothetical protein
LKKGSDKLIWWQTWDIIEINADSTSFRSKSALISKSDVSFLGVKYNVRRFFEFFERLKPVCKSTNKRMINVRKCQKTFIIRSLQTMPFKLFSKVCHTFVGYSLFNVFKVLTIKYKITCYPTFQQHCTNVY